MLDCINSCQCWKKIKTAFIILNYSFTFMFKIFLYLLNVRYFWTFKNSNLTGSNNKNEPISRHTTCFRETAVMQCDIISLHLLMSSPGVNFMYFFFSEIVRFRVNVLMNWSTSPSPFKLSLPISNGNHFSSCPARIKPTFITLKSTSWPKLSFSLKNSCSG